MLSEQYAHLLCLRPEACLDGKQGLTSDASPEMAQLRTRHIGSPPGCGLCE